MRYRLMNPLAGGAVRLGFDQLAHRDVAIRELPEEAVPTARLAMALRHACIVPVLDVVTGPEGTWLVTEFVEGSSLEQTVLTRRPLPPVQVARVGVCLLSALEAAHAAGIAHGRVNPAKVLLAGTGRALLNGFGLPPTGFQPSADFWSLAATMHFALEGRPPGTDPVQGTDPLRSLIRDMLHQTGPPPLDIISQALHDIAENRPAPAPPAPSGPPPLLEPPFPLQPAADLAGVDRPLDRIVGTAGPLPPEQVAAIGLAVLDRLAARHECGLRHGDIRPSTILLDQSGQALLAPPEPVGDPAYTAPEGSRTPASDLWSLGATLFTAVEGHPPAPGAPLNRAGALAPVLFRLLSGDPAQRPTPDILREDLQAIANSWQHV
ncbi:hypothetical protein [Nonomuraea sediminis]|uniref:hypothetical protein n=1 Tax=Nonomuraea sediminis TaxID=2835864 RepID=UPI001BDC32B9|nr:hypothetical protein [Nonomuraea sediminis]